MKNLVLDIILLYKASREQIQEIARKTNIVTAIILSVVGVVFAALVIYLIWFQHKYKRPKRSTARYRSYQSAEAVITGIEEEAYYVKPYSRPVKSEKLKYEIEIDSLRQRRHTVPTKGIDYRRYQIQKEIKSANEKLDSLRFRADYPEQPDVEKLRYKVSYEFRTGSGETYTGEFVAYSESDDIKIGKTVAVKYDPTNPRINFTSYNAPVGTQ